MQANFSTNIPGISTTVTSQRQLTQACFKCTGSGKLGMLTCDGCLGSGIVDGSVIRCSQCTGIGIARGTMCQQCTGRGFTLNMSACNYCFGNRMIFENGTSLPC